MAAPTFVSSSATAGESLTGGNIPLVMPSHQTDDVGLIVVWNRSLNGSAHTVANWSRIIQWDDTIQSDMWSIFGRRFTSAAEAAPTVTVDSGTADSFAMMAVYRGCITTGDPWEAVGVPGFGATNPVAVSGITTLGAERLVVVLGGYGDNNATGVAVTATEPAAYTEHYVESALGGDGSVFIAEAERATAGFTGAFSLDWGIALTASADGAGVALALKPPDAGGGGDPAPNTWHYRKTAQGAHFG